MKRGRSAYRDTNFYLVGYGNLWFTDVKSLTYDDILEHSIADERFNMEMHILISIPSSNNIRFDIVF